jgi:hypothetical protein
MKSVEWVVELMKGKGMYVLTWLKKMIRGILITTKSPGIIFLPMLFFLSFILNSRKLRICLCT